MFIVSYSLSCDKNLYKNIFAVCSFIFINKGCRFIPLKVEKKSKMHKIDILIITYNHEDYIAECIDSVLSQKHDFSYRINIADDCSSDKTRDIIFEYKKRYPDVINLIMADKNMGSKNNFINGTKYLTADYISCLDGDDRWCDDNKLKKQISFLEQNADFVGCSNNTKICYNDGSSKLRFNKKISDSFTIYDFLDGTISFNSSSLVFRNIFKGKVPHSQRHQDAEDLFFTILHAQYGKIKYFEEVMSVYNIHRKGEWSSLNEEDGYRKTIKIFTYAKSVLGKEFWPYIDCGIKRSRKNIYKKITKKQNHGLVKSVLNYIGFRFLCYSIKLYEIRKKR